jgi:predicted RNase H-like HicB family nuclease
MTPSHSSLRDVHWIDRDNGHRRIDEQWEPHKALHGLGETNPRNQDLPRVQTENWKESIPAIIYRARIISLERNYQQLLRKFEDLTDQVGRLRDCVNDGLTNPVVIPISTFAPEGYETIAPIHVVIRRDDEGFVASFVEANINASGDTQSEAISMLKDMILGTYDRIIEKNDDQLGPVPRRQKKLLEKLIRKSE